MDRTRRVTGAGVLLTLGFAALVGSLLAPEYSARRMARIEQRAQETAEVLLACSRALPQPLRFADAEQQRELLRAVQAQLSERGHPQSGQPEAVASDAPVLAFRFTTRHYCFLVAHTPPPEYAVASQPAVPAIEVIAWPDSNLSAGHTAFFFASDAPPAFTRNLVAGYAGFADPPRPGAGRPRGDVQTDPEGTWYRGADDDRWIVIKTRS